MAANDSPVMPDSKTASFQNIAWNGVAFQVPTSWQPVVILNNYLMFEDQYQPILELKWQHIQGSFSVERILKQLRRESNKKDIIEPRAVPKQWQTFLKPFNCYAFTWQGASASGFGILRHCPECNLTILLQLYHASPTTDPDCIHLLKTLRCHHQGNESHWSIYDIDFSLPDTVQLQSQEFLTGRYTLSFEQTDLHFSLLRFKPAQMLLADGGLTAFGWKLLQHNQEYQPGEQNQYTANWSKKGNGWLRFKAKLRRKQADHFLLLHHYPEKNVILGIRAKSNKTLDTDRIQSFLAACKAS